MENGISGKLLFGVYLFPLGLDHTERGNGCGLKEGASKMGKGQRFQTCLMWLHVLGEWSESMYLPV